MSRLGRNPFEKKAGGPSADPSSPTPSAVPAAEPSAPSHLLDWAAIDLPAHLVIGGIKVGLFAHALWSTWIEKEAPKR